MTDLRRLDQQTGLSYFFANALASGRLIGEWQPHLDPRASARAALDLHCSVQLRDALANAQQAQATAPARLFRMGHVESHPIVFHDDPAGRGIGGDSHSYRAGVRVPRDVGQRFLNDAIHRALNFVAASMLETLVSKIHRNAIASAKVRQL
jgi:hypothetical protein